MVKDRNSDEFGKVNVQVGNEMIANITGIRRLKKDIRMTGA